MEGKENNEKNVCGKKIKQQISIPFQWEEAPGTPKKDWSTKHSCESLTSVPLPMKYVASIPFKWEEKPGTPLRTFARDPTRTKTVMEQEIKSLPLPPGYLSKYEGECSNGDDYEYEDQDTMSEIELEVMSIQSDESFFSAPSFLANRLTPLRNLYMEQQSDGSDPFDDAFSPESRKGSVNYAAANASLKGADFLAQLFPNPPKFGSCEEEKTRVPERKHTFLEEQKKLVGDGRRSRVIKRPCTLGELIMQSRRRSYCRKAGNMKKNNQQKNFTKNKLQGCFDIVASGGLAKMLRKDFLALKLS